MVEYFCPNSETCECYKYLKDIGKNPDTRARIKQGANSKFYCNIYALSVDKREGRGDNSFNSVECPLVAIINATLNIPAQASSQSGVKK